jgi:alcohol dehydrogenase (cytochrome c)
MSRGAVGGWLAAGILTVGTLGGAQAASDSLLADGPVSFTAAQAARGKTSYEDFCASCHGRNLDDGQFGPPVKGTVFRAQWHSQSAAALETFVATRMPPTGPVGLDSQAYADIDAYLLQQNGESAGASELVAASVPPGPRRGPAAGGDNFANPDNQDALYRQAQAASAAILAHVPPVSDAMLRDPPAADWLMWRRTYDSQGFSPLTQINRGNVANLRMAWSLALPVGGNEITPLVHDGVLFIESANTVDALDAASGRQLWQYVRALPAAQRDGRGARMKGMAIYQDLLYAPTADGHIVALDIHNGNVRWDHPIITPAQGVSVDGGPIVVNGKVILGVSLGVNTAGGDFIVGLDAHSGAQLWRFHTIAQPGQPGGDSWNGAPFDQRYGGGVWTAGSYDPELNQLYFGTGNTYDVGTLLQAPDPPGTSRDALYTDSTLALNPDTGKLDWYYQHFNGDVWDQDWVFEQTLLTLPIDGRAHRLLVTGGKLAIFDALDRDGGHYEFSKDAGLQNLVTQIDPRTGRKTFDPALTPIGGKSYLVCPSTWGARNWLATSYDPSTDMLYVPLFEACMDYSWVPRPPGEVAAGGDDLHGMMRPRPNSDGEFGRIEAINLRTGQIVWTRRQRAALASSMLASAGGLLFSGSHDRVFSAYDEATGQPLWQSVLNASPNSSPITYAAQGVQYVAVVTGGGGPLDGAIGTMTPEIGSPRGGTTLWVFRLPQPTGALAAHAFEH